MTIKKSQLEQHRLFRAVKVLFLVLPFIVGIYLVAAKVLSPTEVKKFTFYIPFGLLAYYLVLAILWKIALYVGFGGMVDDTKKKTTLPAPATTAQPTAPTAQPTPAPSAMPAKKSSAGAAVFVILFIIIFAIIFAYGESQRNSNSSSGGSTYHGGSSGGGGGTTRAYCNPGNTYNYSSQVCCPNSAPHYYNGAHGIYSVGCYASCPYIGDCSSKTTTY